MKLVVPRFSRLPQLIRFLVISIFINVLVFTVFRMVFWTAFNTPEDSIPNHILFKSFYIGFKFDMRLALFIHLPILLFAWIKTVAIFNKTFGRRLWSIYLAIVNSIILFFYFLDLGHYEYLESRVDATVLRFFYNLKESFQMVSESYPVFWILIILILLIIGYTFIVKIVILQILHRKFAKMGRWNTIIITICFVFLYLFGIYGKFSYYPLRWSDAFFSTYEFASAVSLNPVLYFIDTYKNKDAKYDEKTVRKYYDTIASYLGVKKLDKEGLNFIRTTDRVNHKSGKPNIIMVILESFTYYKTGISGNPMKPTPHFDALVKNSLLFKRFYTPHGGTARSVFTAVTGIPDIELNKTSSRNPLVVRQHTIINAFKGYDKYYFLGGSANWGEIRGLLLHNIPGLHVFEEGSYSSPRIDVWGISDLNLFEEANKVLRKKKGKPFFAIIQTSGNHKPYTIPNDNRGFKVLAADEDEVVKYGFRSVAAFNAFRFMDHSLGIFLKIAKKEDYFNNTIIVFFGDHGLVRNASHMFKAENQLSLNRYHVPLLIYAPCLIKEGKSFNKVASEVDILPTIAEIASIPYVNSTFGRDLLDDTYDNNRYAFTIKHKKGPEIGLIGDKFVFAMTASGTNKRLHQIYSETPRKNVIDEFQKVSIELEQLCSGYYETAKYIRFHNSPEEVKVKANIIK